MHTFIDNVATKNGWNGGDAARRHLYIPFFLLERWHDAPYGSEEEKARMSVATVVRSHGYTLEDFALYAPTRTLGDLLKTLWHEPDEEMTDQQSQPGPDGEDGDSEHTNENPKAEKEKKQPKPKQPKQPKKSKPKKNDGEDDDDALPEDPLDLPPLEDEDEDDGEGDGEGEGEGSEDDEGEDDSEGDDDSPGTKPRRGRTSDDWDEEDDDDDEWDGEMDDEDPDDIPENRKEKIQSLFRQAPENVQELKDNLSKDLLEQRKQAQVQNNPNFSDVMGAQEEADKQLRKRMVAIVRDMVGGFDDEPTMQWDYPKLTRRMATGEGLEPARKREEGVPKITIATDLSGSCTHISSATTQVANAVSFAGDVGCDIYVMPTSNGYLVNPMLKGANMQYGNISNRKWYRNGLDLKFDDVMQKYRTQGTINGLRNLLIDHGFNLSRLGLWLPNAIVEDHDKGLARQTRNFHVTDNGNGKMFSDPNDSCPLDYALEAALACEVMLHNQPDWLILYTDDDSDRIFRWLPYYIEKFSPHTKVVWCDYRTVPNRYDATLDDWFTLRADGLYDARKSQRNYPGQFYGRITNGNETEQEALKWHSMPIFAYSPKYVGDEKWVPSSFMSLDIMDAIGKHKMGRQFTFIPNCDSIGSTIEAMHIVASDDKLFSAKQGGVANTAALSQWIETTTNKNKWLVEGGLGWNRV